MRLRPARRRLSARRARRRVACSRSISSAKRPARSIAPLSTSSSGSTPPEQPLVVLGHRHAEQQAVGPARQVPVGSCSSLNGARCAASRPQRIPLSRDPLLDPREVVVVETEAAADRLAVGEVEHLRGGQPLAGELEQLARRRRAPDWSGAASGRRAGRAGRSARLGRQALVLVVARAAPNVAWISGANVSMSGHMTITSRGSSVGSSASRCRIASRSTSTWRARPWQAWTWMLRSAGRAAVVRRAPGSGAPGGRAVGADVGLDAPRAACRRDSQRVVVVDVLVGAPRTSCSSRASRPQEASSGLLAAAPPWGRRRDARSAERRG